jgi:hypothetical protein
MVGKWHLGFESWDYTPIGRGFDSYYGYLGGGEDYLTHKSGAFVDLTANKSGVLGAGGLYSTELFANASIDRIAAHAAAASPRKPLFLYLAMQAVHSPLEAPAEWVAKYAWIEDKNRRTLAAMTSCLDAQLGRVVGALRAAGMWDNSVFVFVADVSFSFVVYPLSSSPLLCSACILSVCAQALFPLSRSHAVLVCSCSPPRRAACIVLCATGHAAERRPALRRQLQLADARRQVDELGGWYPPHGLRARAHRAARAAPQLQRPRAPVRLGAHAAGRRRGSRDPQ